MIKAYRYKIIPNQEQQQALAKFFGCARFVYNWGLDMKTSSYKNNGINLTYVKQAHELTILKQQPNYEWLQECPIVVLQQALRNLDTAFTAFFRKKNHYPKYKSKKNHKNAIKFIASVYFDFDNWKVKLPKLGLVSMCKNRVFDKNTCKQGICTVSQDACGTYWCVILVDDHKPLPTRNKLDKKNAVGIDLGIKDYATLSDGTKFTNPKHLETAQKRLTKLQRRFARTQAKSKNHEKNRVLVAKCYRKITNRRVDFIHKLTTHLVRNWDTMCVENLNVEGMMKNHSLSRAIQGASWSEFIRQLTYKCEWYGKNIVFIGRFEPSSKLCHNCGYVNGGLKLSDRVWLCPDCGELLDRDVNAAINIREIAFRKQNLVGYK